MKNDNRSLYEVLDLLLEKYGNIEGDRKAFLHGVRTGLNISTYLSTHGVARLSPQVRDLIAVCSFDQVPVVDTIDMVNRHLIRSAWLYPGLYDHSDDRKGIYLKAYEEGVYFGLDWGFKRYVRYVNRKYSNKAIRVLLPRFIDSNWRVVRRILLAEGDRND